MQLQLKALCGRPADQPTIRAYEEVSAPHLAERRTRLPGNALDSPYGANRGGYSFGRILVPTDFSPSSARAIEHAADLAGQSAAILTLLHVIDVNVRPKPGETAAALMKHLWDDASRQMKHLARLLAGRIEARTAIEEGLPWEEIVEKSRAADLIVLGKDDSKSRWRFFARHTAERVIKHSTCPVMVADAIAGFSLRPCA